MGRKHISNTSRTTSGTGGIGSGIPLLANYTREALCACAVFLLFLPKFNLIQVGSETAGIRIDDLLLVAFFFFLLAAMMIAGRTAITRVELIFGCIVAEGLVSNGINLLLFDRSSALYSLRFAEYFLFFYLGYYFAVSHSLTRLARWVLIVNGVVMVLQQFSLIGAATSAGLVSSVEDRPVGLTGGPWEIGAIINFCFAILLFDRTAQGRTARVFGLFVATLGLVLLTGSRMALAAQILLLLFYFYGRAKNAFRFGIIAATTAAIVLASLIFIPNPVAARSENLFTTDNFKSFQKIYDNTPDNPQIEGLGDFQIPDGGDLSWLIRSAKWAGAIKGWNRTLTTIFFGIGPGTLGPSLDGGLLRILSETGLIGFCLFFLFFRWIVVHCGVAMRGVLFALLVSMLMIDIHIAYKAMSFFFFALGFFYYRRTISANARKKTIARSKPPSLLLHVPSTAII